MSEDEKIINTIKKMNQEGKSDEQIQDYLSNENVDIVKADLLSRKAKNDFKEGSKFDFNNYTFQMWHLYILILVLFSSYVFYFSNEILLDIIIFSSILLAASIMALAVSFFLKIFIKSNVNREQISNEGSYILGAIIYFYYEFFVLPLGISYAGSILLAGAPLHLLFIGMYDLSLQESIALIVFTIVGYFIAVLSQGVYTALLLKLFVM